MKTSDKGIQLIKKFESLHDGDLSLVGLQPKLCPAGIWTEGWGRAMRGSDGKFLKGMSNKKIAYKMISIHTVKDANLALEEDLRAREMLVMQKIRTTINQNQFDALVSHVYNTGGSDTLFNLISKNSHISHIEKWFTTKYITQNGGRKKLEGLVRRRREEFELFIS